MGPVSSACRQRRCVSRRRRRDLSNIAMVDETKTPKEIQRLDDEEILQDRRREQLGLLWRSGRSGIPPRRNTQRETLASPSLERAKRTLPNVSAENHQDHRLAQPSRSMEIKRWLRHGRKPRAPSSQLPPTITQPGFTRGETASCKGRWKGLSCLTRKFHEQFLGGGVLVTASCYPTRMCRMRTGLQICYSMVCSRPVLCRARNSKICEI